MQAFFTPGSIIWVRVKYCLELNGVWGNFNEVRL